MPEPESRANALRDETSPYLLQHADNPVEWYPWGEAALTRAREEGRPLLLSIGYSACHWCHVMAHESFEDPDVAAVMNARFVNVKVDREERPDLDRIYQLAHQLLTQRPGGWPLTVFLTPDDHTPFFAGTYFPPQARYGMPSFRDLLARVADHFEAHADELGPLREQIVDALARVESADTDDEPHAGPLDAVHAEFARAYDERHGGFGSAPKFPHASNMEVLLRRYARHGDAAALEMVTGTLERMAAGGIYDQLGGGFCRYSVDAEWMIPHFEKMLYDNGPLLELCAEVSALTGDGALRRAASETAGWVMREMQSADGGYYSTIDADSEGDEGKYYVWQRDEVRALLDDAAFAVTEMRYGLDREPNFENKAWHLHTFASIERIATACALPAERVRELLDGARATLLMRREERIRPGLDDKILTSWNALMIRGMARASTVLGESAWAESATAATDFLRERHWVDGALLATSRGGPARLAAYLDDHAFTLEALLTLLECRWRAIDLEFATALAEALLERFADEERGGFYFTASDHEQLLHRPRPFADDALPAGNAVAARALARLGHVLGESRYLDAAERTVRAGFGAIERHPSAHAAMLVALDEWLEPPETVIIRGSGETLERWRARAAGAFAPRRLTLAIPADAGNLPGLLAERKPGAEGPRAYLCRGHHCEAPIDDYDAFDRALAEGERSGASAGDRVAE